MRFGTSRKITKKKQQQKNKYYFLRAITGHFGKGENHLSVMWFMCCKNNHNNILCLLRMQAFLNPHNLGK